MELSPSAFLVLGYIARRGPMTPYDLKRAVSRSIAYFWDFPHSQLYVEPERLARLGLLTEEREDHGRRRRVFSITEKGREALDAWLRAPIDEQPEVRDLGLLKLFFSGLTSPGRIRELAEEQLALHRQRLAEYEGIAADLTGRYQDLYPHQVPVRMGLLFERACLSFWQSVLEDPPAMDPRVEPLDGQAIAH